MSEEVMASEVVEESPSAEVSHETSADPITETTEQVAPDGVESEAQPETYTKDHVDHIVRIQQLKAERREKRLQGEIEQYKSQPAPQQYQPQQTQQPNQAQAPNTTWDDLTGMYVPNNVSVEQYKQIVLDAAMRADGGAVAQPPVANQAFQQPQQQVSAPGQASRFETRETDDQIVECEDSYKDFHQTIGACQVTKAMGNAASAFSKEGIAELYKASKADPMALLKIAQLPEQQQTLEMYKLLNKRVNAPKRIVETKATPQPEALSGTASVNKSVDAMNQDELNQAVVDKYYS